MYQNEVSLCFNQEKNIWSKKNPVSLSIKLLASHKHEHAELKYFYLEN